MRIVDEVIMQLKERFSENAVELLKKCASSRLLVLGAEWNGNHLKFSFFFYIVNPDLVANEMNEFAAMYAPNEDFVSFDKTIGAGSANY